MRSLTTLAPRVLIPLLAAASASAQTISLPVVVDAEASSDDGFASILNTNQNPGVLDVNLFPNGSESRAALEFDISTLPPSGDIVSASLVLFLTESNELVGVHAAAGDGVITDDDFQFTNEITTFDPTSGVPAVQNTVDVTAYVQSAAGVDAGVVFQLRELFVDEVNEILGSGSSDPALHPRLDIVVIPEPASLALLGCGGFALAARRRR